jgi:hypothetical protein
MVAQKQVAFLVERPMGDEACAVAGGRVLVVVQGKCAACVKDLIEEGGLGGEEGI